MADVLNKIGFSPNTLSVNGVADALVGLFTKTLILDPFKGVDKLNPRSSAQPIWDSVKKLNAATNIGSSIFGETWSNLLFESTQGSNLLKDAVESTTLLTTFPNNELGSRLELIAKLIKSKDVRGKREVIRFIVN
jgi:hypothetical protein